MSFRIGDIVRLRGSAREMTVVRIVGTHVHCSLTRTDKSKANALLRLSDLELADRPPATVDAA